MDDKKKHILIADDHGVVRYGMMLMVKDLVPWSEIHQVENFSDAVSITEQETLDLIILDINIPGGKNIQMLEILKNIQPNVKILMFSAHDESMFAIRYLQAGANGYLNKQTSSKEIKLAINNVLEGKIYMSQVVKDLLINHSLNTNSSDNPINILSNRELEVAQMLVSGHGVTEISNSLDLQLSTVSTYKNRIFEKLDIDNIVQLIEKFRSWNMIDSI
jgi:DNA-binding NarL/FixJ family response regulator